MGLRITVAQAEQVLPLIVVSNSLFRQLKKHHPGKGGAFLVLGLNVMPAIGVVERESTATTVWAQLVGVE